MTASQYNVYPILTPVRLVSNANIAGFYQNGQANNGVGASISVGGNSLTIDSVAAQNNDRVLLEAQTNGNENGIYVVSGINGSGVLLTRSADMQCAEQLHDGMSVSVGAGTAFEATIYVVVEPLPAHFGVDDLNILTQTASGGSLGTAAFKDVSDNAQPTVASVSGATVADRVLVAADLVGTVKVAGVNAFIPQKLFVGSQAVASGTIDLIPFAANSGDFRLLGTANITGDFVATLTNAVNITNDVTWSLPVGIAGDTAGSLLGTSGMQQVQNDSIIRLGKANGTQIGGAVTASGQSGFITSIALVTAPGGVATINWTNTFMQATSVVTLTLLGGTNTLKNVTFAVNVGAGSGLISICNNNASPLDGTLVIGYSVL